APQLSTQLLQLPVHLTEGRASVEPRLAEAERVEVRTMEHQDTHRCGSQERPRARPRSLGVAPAASRASSTRRPGIKRGTLAWPIRGVNTQRTRWSRRFLSRPIASS